MLLLDRAEKVFSPGWPWTWAVQIQRLRGHNKATIALANKLARIAWAVWRRDQQFNEVPIA